MKKILFILLLLIPFIVKADVHITDVELVKKSDAVEAEEHPSFEGLTINLNLEFTKVNDYAEYRVTIKNDTKEEYEIDEENTFEDAEYINYNFEFETNDNKVLKPNETKTFLLIASYKNEVPPTAYTGNTFSETKALDIVLSRDDKVINPKTSVSSYIIAIVAIAIISVVLLVIFKHKQQQLLILLLAITLIIPLTVKAIVKLRVHLETTVVINPDFVKVNYFKCEFPNFNPYGDDNQEEDIVNKTIYFRPDSSIWVSDKDEDFKKLNNNYDYMWSSNGLIFPLEFLDCVNQKENVPWKENMTEEETTKHNEYVANVKACAAAEYDLSSFGLEQDYHWEELEVIPVFDETKAVYYLDDCFVSR